MARILNGMVTVPSFDATGNPGEYTITSAIYVNRSDTSGSGAFAIETGMVLFVPVVDAFTFAPIPGVSYRYKITAVTAHDPEVVDLTIIWDDEGEESETLMNGSACILSEVSPNYKYGYPVPEILYPELLPGSTASATNNNFKHIADKQQSGGGGNVVAYVHDQSELENIWVVQHNKNSLNFVYTIFDDMQVQTLPHNVQVINENRIVVHMLANMKGKAIFSFV